MESSQDNSSLKEKLIAILFDLPWFKIIGELWKFGHKLIRGFSSEGTYEVLDYECRVELKDRTGKSTTIHKREKIRYLQDYITSYLDQAWGDGKFLLNYQCSPGVPVDQYQLGHNTYKLISLREFKNKGDIDEFHIEWEMQNGFLKSTGFWGTSINHRTKKVTVKVIFPKERPPFRASIFESHLQRSHILGSEAQQRLPDGRQMIVWKNTKPRLYEDYILKWEW